MTEHRMRVAFPSQKAARQYGLQRNHQLRVWCDCMAHQKYEVGKDSLRSPSDVANDPRRLGGWDWLGVADSRIPGSALELFRQHVKEAEGR